MQTREDTCSHLYCPSWSPFQAGCPGRGWQSSLCPGLGQSEGLPCLYLSPNPLPSPHKRMR